MENVEEEINKQLRELSRYFINQWPCEVPIPHPQPSRFSKKLCFLSKNSSLLLPKSSVARPSCKPSENSGQSRWKMQHTHNLCSSTSEIRNFHSDLSRYFATGLKCDAPKIRSPPTILIARRLEIPVSSRSSRESSKLAILLEDLKSSKDWIHRRYGEDLGASHSEYLKGVELVTPNQFPWSQEENGAECIRVGVLCK
jgi:hypothetical protein